MAFFLLFRSSHLNTPYWQVRWGEVRWVTTRGSIPQGSSSSPLILRCRYNHRLNLNTPPQEPLKSPSWIQTVLISLIFISTLKKEKNQRTQKNLFVPQSSTDSLGLKTNEEFHCTGWNSSALPGVCLLLCFPKEEGEPEFPVCVEPV